MPAPSAEKTEGPSGPLVAPEIVYKLASWGRGRRTDWMVTPTQEGCRRVDGEGRGTEKGTCSRSR